MNSEAREAIEALLRANASVVIKATALFVSYIWELAQCIQPGQTMTVRDAQGLERMDLLSIAQAGKGRVVLDLT